jgi:prolyl-tRNA editing enzyme YbaK/EbsC (Cys-tRNA(Pro) deacylase)
VDYPRSVQKVVQALQAQGHRGLPTLLDDAARTAQQAADGLGVALGQIAKSIIFKREPDGVQVLVVTAGDRRVDAAKVQARVCGDGQGLARADAAFVRARTGFAIGGVPPLAHAEAGVVVLDASLQRFALLWAAAGHPHSVFPLSPADLARLTGAAFVDVVEEDGA